MADQATATKPTDAAKPPAVREGGDSRHFRTLTHAAIDHTDSDSQVASETDCSDSEHGSKHRAPCTGGGCSKERFASYAEARRGVGGGGEGEAAEATGLAPLCPSVSSTPERADPSSLI